MEYDRREHPGTEYYSSRVEGEAVRRARYRELSPRRRSSPGRRRPYEETRRHEPSSRTIHEGGRDYYESEEEYTVTMSSASKLEPTDPSGFRGLLAMECRDVVEQRHRDFRQFRTQVSDLREDVSGPERQRSCCQNLVRLTARLDCPESREEKGLPRPGALRLHHCDGHLPTPERGGKHLRDEHGGYEGLGRKPVAVLGNGAARHGVCDPRGAVVDGRTGECGIVVAGEEECG